MLVREAPRPIQIAARRFILDGVLIDVVTGLRHGGVEPVLLKGPSIAGWLYTTPLDRPYFDIDLLLDPSSFDRTREIMVRLGFEPSQDALLGDQESWTDEGWLRVRDGALIELHRTFKGISVEPMAAWRTLSSRVCLIQVGDVKVTALDESARCLLLALHASMHGGLGMTLEDLRRGLRMAPLDTWKEAWTIAGELGAGDPFSAGLELLSEGIALQNRLGIPRNRSAYFLLQASGATNAAQVLGLLVESPGSPRRRLLRRLLLPSPAHLRARLPIARKGILGLGAAYLLRWWALGSMALRAAPDWRRAWTRSRARGR